MELLAKSWAQLLSAILTSKSCISPRGRLTLEIPQYSMEVDMAHPVLLIPEVNLDYRTMLARAYWTLLASNRLDEISPYDATIITRSDDGETLFGAYGPMLNEQLTYVVTKLVREPITRQAGLTIWRPNPPETKDVPDTIGLFFTIRNGTALNCHAFMRSAEAWTGVPYSIFTFSMITNLICCLGNRQGLQGITPGTLYLTSATSYLYEANWAAAADIVAKSGADMLKISPRPPVPKNFSSQQEMLMKGLLDARNDVSARWWHELVVDPAIAPVS